MRGREEPAFGYADCITEGLVDETIAFIRPDQPDSDRRVIEDGLQIRFTLPQRLLAPPAFGDVADMSRKANLVALADRRDGQLDRKFRAVAPQRANFDAAVQDMGFAGLEVAGETVLVAVPVAFRDQQSGHRLAENLFFFPTENKLRSGVEADQLALRVDADYCVQRRVDDQAQARLAFR